MADRIVAILPLPGIGKMHEPQAFAATDEAGVDVFVDKMCVRYIIDDADIVVAIAVQYAHERINARQICERHVLDPQRRAAGFRKRAEDVEGREKMRG